MTPDDALLALAETLDTAREAANAIEATAGQTGTYGHVVEALVLTMWHLSYVPDVFTARRIYLQMLITGASVREALTAYQRGELK